MNLLSFNKRYAIEVIVLSFLALSSVCDALKYKKGDDVII